jgi:hypothetical protein
MRPPNYLSIGLAVAALAGVSVPSAADADARHAAGVHLVAAQRGLDFSTKGPSVALKAARDAQVPVQAPPGAAQPIETVTAAAAAPAGDTVSGVTVRPLTQPQGKVIASTEATSLKSPNFSDAEAAPPPLALGLGDNAAVGKQSVDNTAVAGLLHNNPDLLGSSAFRTDVGVTAVF